MKRANFILLITFSLLAFSTFILAGCSSKETSHAPSVAVFVPGIMADSPTYAHLAQGVQEGIDEYNKDKADESKAKVYIMEAGTNQAEWATKLTSLAAAECYDVIISSNPSIPEIADTLTQQFPNQKFVLLDGALTGNDHIACLSYNQKEQTYLAGYIAGLVSTSHKVGLISAQDYPVMNNILYPYYKRGAEDAYEGTTCEYRVVGNWYDASKGAEIADSMSKTGIDVILPICGGASQGVIASAKENNIHLAYIDDNSFAKAPGLVICSIYTAQVNAAREAVLDYLNGNTQWGTTRTVGLQEGYIGYVDDDPLYISTVSQEVRDKMQTLLKGLLDGSIKTPQL